MTRKTVPEYARAVSPRHLRAGKREKGLILDEFCKTTGAGPTRRMIRPRRAEELGSAPASVRRSRDSIDRDGRLILFERPARAGEDLAATRRALGENEFAAA